MSIETINIEALPLPPLTGSLEEQRPALQSFDLGIDRPSDDFPAAASAPPSPSRNTTPHPPAAFQGPTTSSQSPTTSSLALHALFPQFQHSALPSTESAHHLPETSPNANVSPPAMSATMEEPPRDLERPETATNLDDTAQRDLSDSMAPAPAPAPMDISLPDPPQPGTTPGLNNEQTPIQYQLNETETAFPTFPDGFLSGESPELLRQIESRQQEVRRRELERQQGLKAFARLKFRDGSYYMHTYNVILGRDIDRARRDERRRARAEMRRRQGNEDGTQPNLRGGGRRLNHGRPRSLISESGGIVSAPMSAIANGASRSHSSSSRDQNETNQAASHEVLLQVFQEVPDQLESHVPEDPYECPLVPIHPSHADGLDGGNWSKTISRQHAKIEYDFESTSWQMHVLGTNGLCHEGRYYDKGALVELNHGDAIGIGQVTFHFFLPDVALTDEQRAARQESSSRPMSFSFENGLGQVEDEDWSDERSVSDHASVDPKQLYHMPERHHLSDEDTPGDSDMDMDDVDDSSGSASPLTRPTSRKQKKQAKQPKRPQTKHQKLKLKLGSKRQSSHTAMLPPPVKKEDVRSNFLKRKHDLDNGEGPSSSKKSKLKFKGSDNDEGPSASRKAKINSLEEDNNDGPTSFTPNSPLKGKAKGKEPDNAEGPRGSTKGKGKAKEVANEASNQATPTTETAADSQPSPLPAANASELASADAPAAPRDGTMDLDAPELAAGSKTEGPSSRPPRAESPTIVLRPAAEAVGLEGATIIDEEFCEKYSLSKALVGMAMEQRKGPGRPPKDGVMSKRQRSQLVKYGKEFEKAKALGVDLNKLPMTAVKPKVARPRKDTNATAGEGEEGEVRETVEKGDGAAVPADKKSKPSTSKPPRSPSPEMKREDYTKEQLQKPTLNYVVMVYEAITSSPDGQMNLQQIYHYMEKTWPYFKFEVPTNGWQSSVRHNLGQNKVFIRGDREGKGYFWKVDPNVSIEKLRNKRQTEETPQGPHAQHPGFYHPPNSFPQYSPGSGFYGGVPPPQPPRMDTVQPRLPPSLARSAVAAPASQGPPAMKPYASPWGNGGGSAMQGAPRPFGSQPPSNPSKPPPSGQYGVLLPSHLSQPPYPTYGAHNGHGAQGAANGSPYGGMSRPSPYATPVPPPASSHPAQNGQPASQNPNPSPSQPVPQPTHTQPTPPQSVPPQPAPQQASQPTPEQQTPQPIAQPAAPQPHESGRYPASLDRRMIHQLEAFRQTFLEKTPADQKKDCIRRVDNAISAIVYPDAHPPLAADEGHIYNIMLRVPVIKDLLTSRPTNDLGVAAAAEAASDAAVTAAGSLAPTSSGGTSPSIPAASSAGSGSGSSSATSTAGPSPGSVPAPAAGPVEARPTSMPSPSSNSPPPVNVPGAAPPSENTQVPSQG